MFYTPFITQHQTPQPHLLMLPLFSRKATLNSPCFLKALAISGDAVCIYYSFSEMSLLYSPSRTNHHHHQFPKDLYTIYGCVINYHKVSILKRHMFINFSFCEQEPRLSIAASSGPEVSYRLQPRCQLGLWSHVRAQLGKTCFQAPVVVGSSLRAVLWRPYFLWLSTRSHPQLLATGASPKDNSQHGTLLHKSQQGIGSTSKTFV